jgi:hypothetical protein
VRILIRLVLEDRPGALARAAAAIAEVGGDIVTMDVVDRSDSTVTDDFVVELSPQGSVGLGSVANRLSELPGVVHECLRPTPQGELHRELELITRLAVDSTLSLDRLDLLARLIPSIIRCDWAAILTSAGAAVGITHSSVSGPRIRWTNLPWLPLRAATTLDPDEPWVPSAWHGGGLLALAAAPVDPRTTVLACRNGGPDFRPREVVELGQLGALAGRLAPADAGVVTRSLAGVKLPGRDDARVTG